MKPSPERAQGNAKLRQPADSGLADFVLDSHGENES